MLQAEFLGTLLFQLIASVTGMLVCTVCMHQGISAMP